MKEMGVRELKEHTSEALRYVLEKKEAVTITRRGKVIAKLVPIEDESIWKESKKVLEEMDELAKEIGKHWPAGVSAAEAVKEQRREL